jgi:hypothetical protein
VLELALTNVACQEDSKAQQISTTCHGGSCWAADRKECSCQRAIGIPALKGNDPDSISGKAAAPDVMSHPAPHHDTAEPQFPLRVDAGSLVVASQKWMRIHSDDGCGRPVSPVAEAGDGGLQPLRLPGSLWHSLACCKGLSCSTGVSKTGS